MSGEPWFIYRREGGRIRNAPASWQGWFIFPSGIAATMFMVLQVMLATDGFPFFVRFVALSIAILDRCWRALPDRYSQRETSALTSRFHPFQP